MGSKNIYLIALFLSFNALVVSGQGRSDFSSIDSLTYKYYLDGNWKKLIITGKEALNSGIDYKFLRQRLGYAYYIKGDYLDARKHLLKALEYDSFNPFTLEYLYYSSLLSGKGEYSGRLIKKLEPELKKKLSIAAPGLISAIDLEYNFKYSGSVLRSNPQYFRLGLYSRLGASSSLYQSFSKYSQNLKILEKGSLNTYSSKQPEYYGILNINAPSRLIIRTGYHFISTTSGNLSERSNLFILSVSPDFNRFVIDITASMLYYKGTSVFQATLEPGYVFPGSSGFYLKSGVSFMTENGNARFIYNPVAGMRLIRWLWLEGNITSGDMDRYNDYKGLYVYNSYDPIVLRAGGTLKLYIGKKTTMWFNYSYEKKEFYENRSYNYKQFSYLGGIKWEL